MRSFLLFLGLLTLPALGDEPLPPILDATAILDGQEGRAAVDPCADFYRFACGGWLDRTKIPSDKSYVNRQTTAAADNTDHLLNRILESYAHGKFTPSSSAARKVRDFYVSCRNIDHEAPAAAAFVRKKAAAIAKVKGRHATAKLVADLQLAGAGPLFLFGSSQDLNDSSRVIGDLLQGGIALGQRDYYLGTDPKAREILTRYREHVARLFTLLGQDQATAARSAGTVLRLETELAKASYSLADQNDPSKTNHPMRLPELAKLAPSFDWATYFHALGLHRVGRLNVDEPEFFTALDHWLASTPEADLHTYLTWHSAHSVATRAGGDLEKENFAFWNAYLGGQKERKPRWKICTQAVENGLGYALAEAYVKTFDGAAIKKKTETMIGEIKAAFAEDLAALSHGPDAWIDAATLASALRKAAALAQKVGGPVKWRDYSSLRTRRSGYLENSLAVNRFESFRDVRKIGKPVDRLEWGMMPWEINAYYDRSKNEFNFPFGILQPPSLDLHATNGANLGAFGGGTIGHELTHGFDNNGSQYDAKGNIKNWWSAATLEQFRKRSACYVDQADHYRIEAVGLNVSGKNTLEENLADQGGVKLGYAALEKALAGHPGGAPFAGRYDERQQYWLAYAQSWCTKVTPESLREAMTTDVHPPAEFRVNAVVMNRPEFARDFHCASGAKMAPVNRCSLW
jgi:endothelin-converting enzyme/putative endopeptidase